MSDLPAGWNESTIVNLIGKDGLFSDGDWVESKDQDPNGAIRLLQLADIGDGKFINKSHRFVNDKKFELLNFTEILEDDVLVARMPDPLGRACLMPKLPQKCITVVDVAIIRPGKDSVLPRWLMHFLNSPEIRQRIELLSSGTTRKRISRGNLAQIELPIPPLDEQKRIAEKLDTLLARVDSCQTHLDRVPQILKRFRQSVLAAATSGRLTEDWREERQQDLDETWKSTLFEDLIFDGPKNGLYKPSTAYGSGVCILRIDMFYDGEVLPWDKIKRLVVSKQELSDYALAIGDIVINRVNSLPYLGKSALIRSLPEPCVFESNMMRIRVDTSQILPEYCMRFLSSPEGIVQLRQNAKHAVNQASINQTDIKSVNIPLPPLEEQAEIVRRVEKLFAYAERLEARYTSASEHVERLTPSLLAKAFRGELVGQEEPGDSHL